VNDNSKHSGTESRNIPRVIRCDKRKYHEMSKKGAQIKTLCLFCNKGELHCRCLAGDDEPDYYDVYLSREREFLPDLVTSDDTILDCQSGESNYNTMIMSSALVGRRARVSRWPEKTAVSTKGPL
jgi:hypothetical protein